MSVYVLLAILKTRPNLTATLYQIQRVLNLTLFERTPLDQLLTGIPSDENRSIDPNQMSLFDLRWYAHDLPQIIEI